jgi:hypothetical protein
MIRLIIEQPLRHASVITMLERVAPPEIQVIAERRRSPRRRPFRGMRELERRTPQGRNAYGQVEFADRRQVSFALSCTAKIVVVDAEA